MTALQQFFLIAGLHFLALLSPGPDFLLIVRSALCHGVRLASGVCLGIAAANGIYIALALAGVSLLHGAGALFDMLRWAGCAYLAWLGWVCLRSRGAAMAIPLPPERDVAPLVWRAWRRECLAGFLSGLLNPKNALFYASLFALVGTSGANAWVAPASGAWMFFAVLAWDLLVASVAGHPLVVRRLVRHASLITRVCGVIFLALAGLVAGVV